MSFTVVPLLGLDLGAGARVPFGKYFVLQDVPKWLKENTDILRRLSEPERKSTLSAKHALVSEYFANSWGFPDPDWTGANPKGIQVLRFEAAMLANMSVWLIKPSPVHFTMGFHARTHLENITLDIPIIDAQREPRLWPHPRDNNRTVSGKEIIRAAKLYAVLSTVQRKNAIWPALRAIWGALVSYPPDQRYPMFWQALESLFGSETDKYSVSRRLRERISCFLAENPRNQKELNDKVEACYGTRSDIVHGRWEQNAQFEEHMYITEAIVRTVVRHMADKPGMLDAFLSPKRDDFLEAWVRSRALAPPPFPR